MTHFVETLTELRNVEVEIARVDDLITQHPDYESLLLDRDSLIKQHSSLISSMTMKITDAMLDAGCEIMAERWVELTAQGGLDAVPDIVAAIYEAMDRAREIDRSS